MGGWPGPLSKPKGLGVGGVTVVVSVPSVTAWAWVSLSTMTAAGTGGAGLAALFGGIARCADWTDSSLTTDILSLYFY